MESRAALELGNGLAGVLLGHLRLEMEDAVNEGCQAMAHVSKQITHGPRVRLKSYGGELVRVQNER